jgi:predicted dehydrogenase
VANAQLRWGVLGTGAIAGVFTDDLQHTDSGLPVAVGSRTAEGARRFARAHSLPRAHASYEALVADPDVDVVYVATPHPFHHANARLALEAGKHVLIEKAFTMTAAEARDLVDLARSRRLFLMEAMWTRFLPHVAEVRQLIAQGTLGSIVTVIADHGQWFPYDATSRLFAPELGGGALLDLGVYPVSFASMLLGAPDRIVTIAEPAPTGVDAQTSIILRYASGAHALLTCTSSAVSPTRASIVGTEAHIDLDSWFFAPGGFTLTPRAGEPIRSEPPHTGVGLHYEAAEVARCISAGLLESPLMPLDETVTIMQTLDAIRG